MIWIRRAVPLVVGLAGLAVAAPAGAISATTAQAAPAVVSPYEPIPGTARNVSLVGHLAPPGLTGTTPAGQYAALAMAGDCAYIGRRNFNSTGQADDGLGVQIVDISNPAAPVYRGAIPGTVFTDSTARELRAIAQYRLLIILNYSKFTGGGVNNAAASTGGFNVMQAYRINPDCSATHLADYDMGPLKPHEFYVWVDPKVAGRVIAYVSSPFGPGELEVLDFSSCSAVGASVPSGCAPSLLTIWDGAYPQPSTAAVSNSGIGNYVHSLAITPDGRTGLMAFWNGGFFTVDTSQVADGRANPIIVGEASTSFRDDWSLHNGPTGQGGDAHSAVWVPSDLGRSTLKPYVVLTDEDYLGIGDCPFGWLHIDQLQSLPGGLFRPLPLSSFGLPENTLKQEAAVIANAGGQTSQLNSLLGDPGTCSGYTRDHAAAGKPAYIAADPNWPGGQVPANTYSSHNPTTLPDLVLLTWYGGGFQVVDIHDPAHPSSAGYLVPTPEPVVDEELDDSSGQYLGCYFPQTPSATNGQSNCSIRDANRNTVNYSVHPQVAGWSYPIIKDGLIYFVDNRNGLYIVKYTGAFSKEVTHTRFAEGNSNQNSTSFGRAPDASVPAGAAAPAVAAPAGNALAARPAAALGRRLGVSPAALLLLTVVPLLVLAAVVSARRARASRSPGRDGGEPARPWRRWR